jgi:hypothetical protein
MAPTEPIQRRVPSMLPRVAHAALLFALLAGAWAVRTYWSAQTDVPTEPPRDAHASTVSAARPEQPPKPAEFVTASHILILHNQTSGMLPHASFWQPLGTSSHTVQEAQQLIDGIAREAQLDPARFGELAARHSEDVRTSAHGGSLGTLRYEELPPALGAALAKLEVGQVSPVVKTTLGYHVLHKRAVPPDQTLAGEQIAIAYWESDPVFLREGHGRRRTRAEAEQLARHVASLARAGADPFGALVQRYSDHADASRNGDLGVWRLHAPADNARELELLAALPVGGISEPLDTPAGFKVLKRTADLEREQYAVRALLFPFRPGDSPARGRAREEAEAALAELRRKPGTFDAKASGLNSYLEFGRGLEPIGLLPAVAALEIGQLALEIIEGHTVFAIVKRVNLGERPAPAPPSQGTPDLERLFAVIPGSTLAKATREFTTESPTTLTLGAAGAKVEGILEELARQLDNGSDGPASYRAAVAQLHQVVDERDARFVLAMAHDWVLRSMKASMPDQPAAH